MNIKSCVFSISNCASVNVRANQINSASIIIINVTLNIERL